MAKTKLPKEIIKKYGITKKAWSVFRAGKSGASKTMAKTRKAKTSFRSKARSYSRKVSSSPLTPALGALLYGAGRQYTLGKLDPLLAKIPLAGFQYVDELAMFGLSYALAKGKIPFVSKFPITRSIGRAGMIIEAYRVGASLAQNGFFSFSLMSSSATSTASNVPRVIG